MKSLIKLLSFVAVIAFFATSCDKCADVTCGTNSSCEEGECICFPTYVSDGAGNCVCPTGYEAAAEGDSCSIEWSAKFVGTSLSTTEDITAGSANPGTFTYNMDITRVDEKTLTTTNYQGYGATNVVEFDVVDSYTLSLNYTDVGGRIYTGSGSIAGNTIVIDAITQFPTTPVTYDTVQTIITK